MFDFLSVNNIAFTVLGYPMSYIELVGTILYLLSVYLIVRRNILTWPVGIASVLLYMVLFYQIQLYSDTLEQVYYLFASVYGWWFWNKTKQDQELGNVLYSNSQGIMTAIAVTAVLTLLVTALISQIHILLPVLFPIPADLPFLDALTTVMSFTAMWLMARKRVESWIYWIIVDIIGIGLYFYKDVRFLSLLYVVLLVMAINGFITWHRATSGLRSERLSVKTAR